MTNKRARVDMPLNLQCKEQKEVEMCLIVEDDGEWQEAPLEQAEALEAQGILYHCKDHNGKCLDYYDGKVYHRVSMISLAVPSPLPNPF